MPRSFSPLAKSIHGMRMLNTFAKPNYNMGVQVTNFWVALVP